jgi:hypothetical protein
MSNSALLAHDLVRTLGARRDLPHRSPGTPDRVDRRERCRKVHPAAAARRGGPARHRHRRPTGGPRPPAPGDAVRRRLDDCRRARRRPARNPRGPRRTRPAQPSARRDRAGPHRLPRPARRVRRAARPRAGARGLGRRPTRRDRPRRSRPRWDTARPHARVPVRWAAWPARAGRTAGPAAGGAAARRAHQPSRRRRRRVPEGAAARPCPGSSWRRATTGRSSTPSART